MGSNAMPLFGPKAGDNQFGSYGTGMPAPGIVPSGQAGAPVTGQNTGVGKIKNSGQGYSSVPTLDPGLTNSFFNFLQGQIGQGATPFDLSAVLPSTGQSTAPGQLTPGLTPVMQSLEDFYSGKASNIPGSGTLSQMAKNGSPIDQTPAWQAMIAAQNKNTAQNAANLREQFAFSGNLKGTPFAQSMTDFYNQNALNQNAQLTQATAQAQEAAANRSLSASGSIMNGSAQLGQVLQGLDQQAISSLMQEFIRTRPEYSPYLNMLFGASTTFAPAVKNNTFLSNFTTALGGTLGKGIGEGASALAGSGMTDAYNTIPFATGA